MKTLKIASFEGYSVGIRDINDMVYRCHDLMMCGWELMEDPTAEIPYQLLKHFIRIPADENSGIGWLLKDSDRRMWAAAFAKEYAHSEELRQICANFYDDEVDDFYPVENPQVEDDEEKEVVESSTESSEDTHGGSEATKSINESPSSADDGEEEKNDSTSKGNSGGDDDTRTPSSGKNGDTDAETEKGESGDPEDTDANKEGKDTSAESKDGKGSGAPEDTDADKEGKGAGTEPNDNEGECTGAGIGKGDDSSEVTNKIVSDLISAFEEEATDRNNRAAIVSAFAMVLKNTKGKSDKGSRLGGWDGRAITKHYISGMLNRIPTDRKRCGAVKQVTVAIDCSGSCWTYLSEINRAIRHIAKFYNVQILDCSNGFNPEEDSTVSSSDPFDNRKRLEEAFCAGTRIKMHPVITTPSIKTAARIAEQSEAFIVLADYDGYLSICRMVQQVTNPAKYPWFLDLEERYEDPSSHSWNWDEHDEAYVSAEDYPVPARKRWLRLFERGCGDEE